MLGIKNQKNFHKQIILLTIKKKYKQIILVTIPKKQTETIKNF